MRRLPLFVMRRTIWQLVFMLSSLLIISAVVLPRQPVYAAGTVGTGTAASCTEAALDGALVGGGTIRFNCGAGAVTIPITTTKVIDASTFIDGGGKITLRGNRATRLFTVNTDRVLTVIHITLSNGVADSGGAILNHGLLNILASTVSSNTANTGGAVYHDSPGLLLISESTFVGNVSNENGGAIMASSGSKFSIYGSSFLLNRTDRGYGAAIRGAGQIYNSTFSLNAGGEAGGKNIANGTVAADGELRVTGSRFAFNVINGDGGGIYLMPSVPQATISRSQFTRNTARGSGGGIYIDFGDASIIGRNIEVDIARSRFEGNRAYRAGGGIFYSPRNTTILTIKHSQLVGNSASDGDDNTYTELGGGLAVQSPHGLGELYIEDSTFSRNRSINGGGVGIKGASRLLAISTSTFDANTADSGGGFYVFSGIGGDNRISLSTFYANHANRGGAIFIEAPADMPYGGAAVVVSSLTIVNNDNYGILTWGPTSTVKLNSTLLANNTIANCASLNGTRIVPDDQDDPGAYQSASMEYPGNTCGGVKYTGLDPMLGTFGNHGGETSTIDLLSDSPAIDKTYPRPGYYYGLFPVIDQRHFLRPQDGNGDGLAAGDIGAFEVINPADDIGRISIPLTEMCKMFVAVSPLDTISDGMVTFTWKPTPIATSYQLNLYDGAHKLLRTYQLGSGFTSTTLDMSQKAIGAGTTFFWQIQALRQQTVMCSNEVKLTRKPALQPTFVPPTFTPKP